MKAAIRKLSEPAPSPDLAQAELAYHAAAAQLTLMKARFKGEITIGQTGAWLKERRGASSASVNVRAILPDAQLYFITGADALESILSWQHWEELFALAKFVGVSRPGYELHAEHLADHLAKLPADTLQTLEIPALAISSTDCRERAATGRPVWYLVPDGVVQYIAKRRLYRARASRGVSAP